MISLTLNFSCLKVQKYFSRLLSTFWFSMIFIIFWWSLSLYTTLIVASQLQDKSADPIACVKHFKSAPFATLFILAFFELPFCFIGSSAGSNRHTNMIEHTYVCLLRSANRQNEICTALQLFWYKSFFLIKLRSGTIQTMRRIHYRYLIFIVRVTASFALKKSFTYFNCSPLKLEMLLAQNVEDFRP